MGPALQPHIFVGQGPCALPCVRYGIGGRTEASAPTDGLQGVRYKTGRVVREADPYGGVTRSAVGRDDVGIVPYGYITRSAAQIKGGPGGPPLRFLYPLFIFTFYILYPLFIYTLRRFAENQSPRGRGLPV